MVESQNQGFIARVVVDTAVFCFPFCEKKYLEGFCLLKQCDLDLLRSAFYDNIAAAAYTDLVVARCHDCKKGGPCLGRTMMQT